MDSEHEGATGTTAVPHPRKRPARAPPGQPSPEKDEPTRADVTTTKFGRQSVRKLPFDK